MGDENPIRTLRDYSKPSHEGYKNTIELLVWNNVAPLRSNTIQYTQININYAAGGNLRRLSVEEAWETIEDCTQCDKQWKNPSNTISDQTIANLKTQLVENEVVRVKIPKCMAWLDDEPIGYLDTMEDKEDNPSPQRIPMEVESLDHMKLEDFGLNTCNHDIPLSSREIPSVDESEPQLLPKFSPLDEITNVNLRAGIFEEKKKILLYRPWRRHQD
ncbi:hypothetical protein Tco_1514411, partial [Tanacetum coccineum]